MNKFIVAVIVLFCSINSVQAEDKPLNVNTKPVTVYEETFEVFCEYKPKETVCFELVTSGASKGQYKFFTKLNAHRK